MKKPLLIVLALITIGSVAWFIVRGTEKDSGIKNIVLISIDTCRSDYLSSYGYPEPTTPNIDELAGHSTLFEQVVTPVPITLPAHCSMMTGKIPPAHGVHHNMGYQLAPSNITLAETLKEEGFKTSAIISAFVLDRKFGLDQGFDDYDDRFGEHNKSDHGKERIGDETTELALNWLDANQDEKFFLFLHYFDPHYDYIAPEPHASNFESPYAAEIAFTDYCVGRVIQKLMDMGLYESTLLIVVGDHGEMLWEHGEEWHSYFIYESAVKVPLIIKLPEQEEGFVVSETVSIIDILPTIYAQLGLETTELIQGIDLSSFLVGETPDEYDRYLYTESVGPTRFGASSLMGIYKDQWKYIQAPQPELYDVVADRAETNNLVLQEKHRARILEDKLKEILEQSVRKDTDSQMVLDEETIRKLESLGYVAGKEDGEIVFDAEKPDPKDLVHMISPLHEVHVHMDKGEYAEAKTILEELAPTAPHFLDIFMNLGEIGMKTQDYECAVVNYRHAHGLDATALGLDLYNNLAWLQATRPSMAARDMDEALKFAKLMCYETQYKDPHMLDTLAVVYAARGDFSNAIETAEQAWAIAMELKKYSLVRGLNVRLSLYKKSKPYIDE